MAILYRTNCNNKSKIKFNFPPFSKPENIDGMIIGNDLDSLLSACLLKTKFGWDVSGIYDYVSLWYSEENSNFMEKLLSGRYIGVDLDIYHPNIPSIGHHILELDSGSNLPGHRLTLNPNFIRGIGVKDFKRKYPLGTVHFLIWLFDIEDLSQDVMYLVWLADSSFINGQSHRFRDNVTEWINNFLSGNLLENSLEKIDTEEFEIALERNIISKLKKIEICNGSGQVRSRFKSIRGFQCQWVNPASDRDSIKWVLDFISNITGWQEPEFPSKFLRLSGERKSSKISDIIDKYKTLGEFLEGEKVFSYVISFNNSINYTVKIL
jgi:hypothetical protein